MQAATCGAARKRARKATRNPARCASLSAPTHDLATQYSMLGTQAVANVRTRPSHGNAKEAKPRMLSACAAMRKSAWRGAPHAQVEEGFAHRGPRLAEKLAPPTQGARQADALAFIEAQARGMGRRLGDLPDKASQAHRIRPLRVRDESSM